MKRLKIINKNAGQSKRVIRTLVKINVQLKDVRYHKFSIDEDN